MRITPRAWLRRWPHGGPFGDDRPFLRALGVFLAVDGEVAQRAQLLLLQPFLYAVGVERVQARQRAHSLPLGHLLKADGAAGAALLRQLKAFRRRGPSPAGKGAESEERTQAHRRQKLCATCLRRAVLGSTPDLVTAALVFGSVAALMEMLCVARVWCEDTARGHAFRVWLFDEDARDGLAQRSQNLPSAASTDASDAKRV